MSHRASGPGNAGQEPAGTMSKTYVVSGCGMKFDAALWPVPPGVEIHFYFQCMREPQFYKTRTILDKLMLDVGMFPDRVAVAGDMIPSHFVWAHPNEQPPSGVFRRQTGNLALDLAELSGLDCQYPPRLRAGVADDGDESREMPLSGQMPLRDSKRMPLPSRSMGPTEAWPGVRRR